MIKKFIFTLILLTSVSGINLIYAQDTDGDGIANTADLDDDNDGIPDALECTVTSTNMVNWMNAANNFPGDVQTGFTGFITAQNSTAGAGLTRVWVSPQNYQQLSQIAATTESQAITNSEYVEYRITVGTRYLLLNQVEYYISPTSNSTTTYNYTLRMSSDNFATNTLLHNAQNYAPNASGFNFDVNTLQTEYLSPNTTYAFRVYFYNVSTGNAGSIVHDDFKLKGNFECDVDGDNIPNRLDLDSDGDGCFDAIEGDERVLPGQLNSNGSINTAANGGVGTTAGTNNGVPNLVNSGGAADNGSDVGQGVADSQSSLANTQCIDTDSDGIPNNFDLDDDNDGILDTVENACETEGTPVYINNFGTGATTGTDGNVLSHTYQAVTPGDGFYSVTTSGAQTQTYTQTDLTGNLDAGNPVITAGSTNGRYLMININSPGTVNQPIYRVNGLATTVGNRYRFRIDMAGLANGATDIPDLQLTLKDASGNVLATTNSGTLGMLNDDVWRRLNLNFTATTSSVTLEIVNLQGNNNGGNDVGIDNVILTPLTICDTDGDGIPNSQDLDSDGDGCFDAIEGDEKVLLNQLNPNGSINTAANGGIGATFGTNIGVPNLVNSGGAADIGADVGQGVGDSQNASVTTQCLDSDGDGVQNEFDLDDDNDGILDVNETVCATSNSASFNPNTQAWQSTGINMVAGRTYKLQMTGSSLGLVTASGGANNGRQFYPAGFSSSDSRVSDYNGYRYNLPTGGSVATYNSDPQPPVDVAFANLMAADYSNILTFVGMIDNNGNGQYNPGIDVLVPKILDMSQGPAGGLTFTAQTNGTFYIVYADNNYTDNSGTFNFVMQTCGIDIDTDGDGIPNRLDLDSDGDGCTDAIEGGANFTSANLVTATGAIATQTPNQNLGNTVGNTPATLGVPTIAGTGQSVGESQNAVRNDCIDADNDGFPDWQDLDDDNDGILDTAECPPANILANFTPATITTPNSTTTNIAGISFGSVTGNLAVARFGITYFTGSPLSKNTMDMTSSSLYTPTGTATQSALTEVITDFNNTTNFTRYTLTLSAPAESITLHINNFDYARTRFTGAHVEQLLSGGTELVYNPATRQLYDSDPNTVSTPARDGYGSIKITSTNGQPLTQIVYEKFDDPNTTQTADGFFYTYSVEPSCDADGDGIPNRLDLDSDGDGCFDALEGDENVTVNQLNANGSINTTTTGGLGAAATNAGVPNLVNSGGAADIGGDVGQGVGDSQNALVNACYCYKKPVLNAGVTNPTRHGITALNRANSGTTDWPIVRQSAWTVLEANTKGFVVNRVAFSDADANPATPMTPVGIATANYLEGMMVYDTTNNCLKIYNGTVWNCYTTQTCPQ